MVDKAKEAIELKVLLDSYVKKLRRERDDLIKQIESNYGLDKVQAADLKKGVIVNYTRKLDIVVDKVLL